MCRFASPPDHRFRILSRPGAARLALLLAVGLLAAGLAAPRSVPAAGEPAACTGTAAEGLELLHLRAGEDYAQWMAREGWTDRRPFSRSASRFRIADGALRLASAGDSFIIGRPLQPGELRSVEAAPYLRFVVRVDTVPRGARLAGEARDDSAFRLYAVFTDDPLQALAYVWSWELPVGTWSARSRSIWGDFRAVRRKAFGQGEPPAGRWLTVEVDLRRDYAAQFPGAPVPVLRGIALKADSNDTDRQASVAWLRSVSLHATSLRDCGLAEGDRLGDTLVWFR